MKCDSMAAGECQVFVLMTQIQQRGARPVPAGDNAARCQVGGHSFRPHHSLLPVGLW